MMLINCSIFFLFSFEKGRRRRVTKGVEKWSGVFLHSAPLPHRISIHCVGRRKKKQQQQKQSPPFFLISNFKCILLPSLKFPPRIHQSTTRTRNKHPLLLPSLFVNWPLFFFFFFFFCVCRGLYRLAAMRTPPVSAVLDILERKRRKRQQQQQRRQTLLHFVDSV